MLAYQPGDQTAVVTVKTMQLAEIKCFTGPQFGMIAAASLGDVVKQRG